MCLKQTKNDKEIKQEKIGKRMGNEREKKEKENAQQDGRECKFETQHTTIAKRKYAHRKKAFENCNLSSCLFVCSGIECNSILFIMGGSGECIEIVRFCITAKVNETVKIINFNHSFAM